MKQYTQFINDIEGLTRVQETVVLIQRVAASNIMTARKQLTTSAEYENQIQKIITRLLGFVPDFSHPLLTSPDTGSPAVVILSSHKGVVGGLWHALVDLAVSHTPRYEHIIAVGSKANEYCREAGMSPEKVFPGVSETDAGYEQVWSYLMDGMREGRYRSVDIIYPHALSLSVQQSRQVRFLPYVLPPQPETAQGVPIFESTPRDILTVLLSRWVRAQLATFFWETRVAEYAARTSTSEHAQEKTKDLIRKTKRTYIKERRRELTRKQLESFISHTIL